jgi:dimethylhistidine N-methyltransferase
MIEFLDRSDAAQVRFYDLEPPVEQFREAVLKGLAAKQKAIPCRFLYDERGSALFEAICEQPEYYPTRVERAILSGNAGQIGERIGRRAQLVELGSGASRKVAALLRAMDRPAAYVAIDISRDQLAFATRRVARAFPDLQVHAICADYSQSFDLPPVDRGGRRTAFFPGSTIGNFEPGAARGFLAGWSRRLGRGGGMLIGVDLRKSASVLNAAYDDAAGVTAAFSRNLLVRANRELGADFHTECFRHEARYDEAAGRVEIHLCSLARQSVRVAGRRFDFEAGERLHVENSYKYSLEGFVDLARSAGFAPMDCWTDPDGLFSVHYLSATTDGVPDR